MANINRVVVSGNLTRDPELRQLAGGNSVCKLRIAVNTRKKDRKTNQWSDHPNYFDVTVWGAQGENVRQVPPEGLAPADRRTPRVARVAGAGRHEPAVGRDHRREHPVHRRPRRAGRAAAAGRVRSGPDRGLQSVPAATTTTFRSRALLNLYKENGADEMAAPAAADDERKARSRDRRGRQEEDLPLLQGQGGRGRTRTSTPSGATCPRRARSARAASRARAGDTSARWRWRSSALARLSCCRTWRASTMASNRKAILLQDVDHLGARGDVVSVAPATCATTSCRADSPRRRPMRGSTRSSASTRFARPSRPARSSTRRRSPAR